MEKIRDRALLQKALTGKALAQCFVSLPPNMYLLRYHKGELISSPMKPPENILLMISGRARIYGLREDGSSFAIRMEAADTLLGDIEFCRRDFLPFYAEAADEVLCAALPMETNRAELESNPRFLRLLLQSVAGKVMLAAAIDRPAQSLRDKTLAYLREIQPDHTLHSINEGLAQLHCSRRQLQRVVGALCEEGLLLKIGKGKYRLVT